MKEEATATHHYYYGMTFKDCTINNPTFQTVSSAHEAGKKEEKAGGIPDELNSAEAREMKEKLAEADIIDEHWQPAKLSIAEKGVLAGFLADRMNIKNPWLTFGTLWSMQPETLRRGAAKAMGQKKTLVFQDRLKKLL